MSMSCSGVSTCSLKLLSSANPRSKPGKPSVRDDIDDLVMELKAAKENRLPPYAGSLPSSPPPSEPAAPAGLSQAASASRTEPFADKPRRPEGVIIAPVVVPAAPALLVTEESRSEAPGGPASANDRGRDRVVRVTAESLTRLLGLAGEALVQSHRLPPLVESLWRLKGKQTGLLESVQVLEDRVSGREDTLSAR